MNISNINNFKNTKNKIFEQGMYQESERSEFFIL